MRVAQAIALYLPEFEGGATLVCRRLARELGVRGHVVDVFSGRTTAAEPLGALRRDLVDDVLTWRVNLGGAFDPWSPQGWDNPLARECFAEFLAATRPDVVHAHSLQALGVGVLDAAADAGVPVVWTMHDWWWLCPCLFRLSPEGRICSATPCPEHCAGRPGYDFAARRARLDAVLSRVARIVTPSAYLRDSLVANGLDPRRLLVQENGIEPPGVAFDAALGSPRARHEVAGVRAAPGSPQVGVLEATGAPGAAGTGDVAPAGATDGSPLRIVFLGGAGNREKGLGILLDAALRLRGAAFELHCHAVAREETGVAGVQLGSRLHCHPRFAPERLDAVLAAADVVVVPSLMRESFSLVTREALVRGIPVVASDCGGPEEVVRSGENGWIVASGSAEALAAALDRLIADRALVARLAAAPRPSFVTPARQARAAEALYRQVIREAECPAPARTVPSAEGAAGVALAPADGAAVCASGLGTAACASRAAARAAGPSAPDRRPSREVALDGKRVLFLTGIDGAPLRYRVHHLVEQLAGAGVRSRVLYHSDVRALEAAREADCIVLSRAPFSVSVAAAVADARRRRIPVVFSADDLVFSREACDAPALDDPRPEVVAGFRWTLDAYARSLAAADAFLGSTDDLVALAAERGLASYVHRNGLGAELLALTERALLRRDAGGVAVHAEEPGRGDVAAAAGGAASDGWPVRIGFVSGTNTHDRDLARIAPALARVLERAPGARLVVGGPVALPRELAALGERLECWPLVAWSDLPARLATLDVNLAPLELERLFNEAKSELKYLEAAAVGVPTVASPSRPFRTAIEHGTTGLLAASLGDWESAVLRLIDEPELRRSLGRAARHDVHRRYGPQAQAGAARELVAEILARGGGSGALLPSPIAMEAGGGSTVALEPASHVYDAYQLEAESGGPLGPGREVEQSFVCRGDGVWRVDVLVGTYARRNDHEVHLRVLDEDGAVLGQRSVAAATLLDRSFVSVELERPIEASRGRVLRLHAEAPRAREGNEILLWHAPAALGELSVGGQPLPGRALSLRAFGEEAW